MEVLLTRPRLTKITYFVVLSFLAVLIAGPESMAARGKGTNGWSGSADGKVGAAMYAWDSGCKVNCNDEVDFEPIISVDCVKGEPDVSLIFWTLGREQDQDKIVNIWIDVDGRKTTLQAKGASKLNGVSFDLKLPLEHPLFEEMAAGKLMTYGSEAGGQQQSASLRGSRTAIEAMRSACR